MIPYILFVVFILVTRNYKNHRLMFLGLVLFSALRYDVGWDFMSYYGLVNSLGRSTDSVEHYSFIWRWLFQTAHTLNSPQLAIAVPAFLTISISYYVIVKLQVTVSRISDSLAVYALWPFFYLASFSVIRQSLAIAIGLLILYCAINKKFFWFFFLLLVNYFVHPSSIVCIVFAFFFFSGFHLKIWHIIVLSILFVGAASSLNLILENSLVEDYLTYIGESDSYGSKLSILIALVLVPVIIIRMKKALVGEVVHKGIIDIVVLAYILTIIVFVFVNNSVLSRVLDYFVVLLVFVLPVAKQLFKDKTHGAFLIYTALSLILLVYLFITSGAQSQGLASSSYIPYKMILLQ